MADYCDSHKDPEKVPTQSWTEILIQLSGFIVMLWSIESNLSKCSIIFEIWLNVISSVWKFNSIKKSTKV